MKKKKPEATKESLLNCLSEEIATLMSVIDSNYGLDDKEKAEVVRHIIKEFQVHQVRLKTLRDSNGQGKLQHAKSLYLSIR